MAVCQTVEITEVVPKNLSYSIRLLEVAYKGAATGLIGPMFSRYHDLESIRVTGNVTSVEKNTFSDLPNLKNLSITYSKLQVFEAEAFHPHNALNHLQLNDNELTDIPRQSFKEIPHLTHLDLSFNWIFDQPCSTIGEEFRHLTNLTSLSLGNMSVDYTCERFVPAEYFMPLSDRVTFLNLTYTNIFIGSLQILQELSSLKTLDISITDGFRNCPASAAPLFWNLPASLESLVMRHWASISWDCALTAHNISRLKNLTNLKYLDMRHGDLMFGYELDKEVFDGFYALEYLDIGHCRFSAIEDYSFNYCPKLKHLSLEGNPLGIRPFNLYYDQRYCKLKTLNMAHTGIFAEFNKDLKLHFIIRSCGISDIDLRGNLIRSMPRFTNYFDSFSGFLTTISLDDNLLENFHYIAGGDLSDDCSLMSKLTHLKLRQNRLVDLYGLCKSLTHLYLSNNKRLRMNWTRNQAVISELAKLQVFEFAHNDVNNISDATFRAMTDLKEIYLGSNNLSVLSTNLFRRNAKLEIIDLNSNLLRDINFQHFKHLQYLKVLNLQDNFLVYLDVALTDYFEQSTSLTEILLKDNAFSCGCTDQNTQKFIRQTNKVPDAQLLNCSGAQMDHVGEKVFAYQRNTFNCDYRENIAIASSVLGGFLITLLIALPCYKYRWYLKHIWTVLTAVWNRIREVRFNYKCRYDAIVIYNSDSDEDCDFVANHICKEIEGQSDSEAIDVSRMY